MCMVKEEMGDKSEKRVFIITRNDLAVLAKMTTLVRGEENIPTKIPV